MQCQGWWYKVVRSGRRWSTGCRGLRRASEWLVSTLQAALGSVVPLTEAAARTPRLIVCRAHTLAFADRGCAHAHGRPPRRAAPLLRALTARTALSPTHHRSMPKSTMIAEEFDQLHGSDAVKWLKDNVTACACPSGRFARDEKHVRVPADRDPIDAETVLACRRCYVPLGLDNVRVAPRPNPHPAPPPPAAAAAAS